MKAGFMTSVCPGQTMPELVETAQRYGYEGIEFRVEWGHKHGIELGATAARLAAARRMLAEGGIAASCIATSVKFNAPDAAAHVPQREQLRRYIELAQQVGAPCIRTFSDGLPEEDAAARERVLDLAAASYAAVDEWAGAYGVTVLVETHTNMKGQWARAILDRAGARNLAVLWHTGHHLQRGQSVDEAYAAIGAWVRHVHFTARRGGQVVTDADNQRMYDLLARDGYKGVFSVEIIHPQDSDAVLAHHMEKHHQYLGR